MQVRKFSRRNFFGQRRWYWTFAHTNDRNMADGSEGYNSKRARDDALETVRRELARAKVIDLDTGEIMIDYDGIRHGK